MSLAAVLLRPVRATTWRELAYLLLGFGLSIVVFTTLVTLLALGVGLLVTLVGIPILLATAYVNGWFADAERWRTGFVLRERIGRRYRDASGGAYSSGWKRSASGCSGMSPGEAATASDQVASASVAMAHPALRGRRARCMAFIVFPPVTSTRRAHRVGPAPWRG